MTFWMKSHRKWRQQRQQSNEQKQHKRSNVTNNRERAIDDASRSCLCSPSLPQLNTSLFILLISPLRNILAKYPKASEAFEMSSPSTEASSSYSRGNPKSSGDRMTSAPPTSARLATAVLPDDMLVAASVESSGIIDSESMNDIAQMASLPLTSQRVSIEVGTRCNPVSREKQTKCRIITCTEWSRFRYAMHRWCPLENQTRKDSLRRMHFHLWNAISFVETPTIQTIIQLIRAAFKSGKLTVALVGPKWSLKSTVAREAFTTIKAGSNDYQLG